MRPSGSFLVLILAAVSLTGCTASGGEHGTTVAQAPESASRPFGVPRLLTYHDNGNHMLAAFANETLSVNEAGCFALSDGSTIIVPETWHASPDGGGIIDVDGTEIRLGDHFDAGGGFGGPPRRKLSSDQRRCPSDGPTFSNGGKYTSFAGLWGIVPN